MISSSDFLTLAERDYKLCKKLEEDFPDEYAVSASIYHIQQAVEKTLKGVILFHGGEVEFTHNIFKLINQCEKLGFEIEENLKDVADTLTLWESSTRYDPFIAFSQKKYDTAKSAYCVLSEALKQELSQCFEQDQGFEPTMG